MKRLHNQVAMVTGGASGLGRAIARRLAEDGAQVVITDVQCKFGSNTAKENGFIFLEHDTRDEVRWLQVIQEIEDRCGKLNILVNNAGIVGRADAMSPEHARLEDWKMIFSINVEGVFLGCKTAIPAMRRAGHGSIINISSIAGLTATPYATAYGASKAAVRQLTKSVAQYCAEQRISVRCNSVHPGTVRTALVEKYVIEVAQAKGISTECMLAQLEAGIPMGDFTLPEDVAAAVAFLACSESRHITGTKLIVDGGVISCDSYRPDLKNVATAANTPAD